jgi:hypothetical protein
LESEGWHKPPDLARVTQAITVGNKTFHCIIIAKSNAGWVKIDDQVTHEMTQLELKTAREKAYQWQIARLYPLIEDRSFTFRLLEEVKLEEIPVVGIRISSKDHWDVDFFFEKRKSLLVGIRSKEIQVAGEELTVVTTLSAHKDFGGLKFPTRMTRWNGKVRTIEDVIEFTPMYTIDERLFERP